MSARKYNSNIYDQVSQAWRYRDTNDIASATIENNQTLSMTLADGQVIVAAGKVGYFSATPGVPERIFYSDGNVGIGPVQNPPTSLYVSSNNLASVSVATYSDTHSSKITIDNARGNADNPQDAAINDTSSFIFRNYQSGVWVNSGSIRSTLKGAEGKANLDFYTNGGTGEVKRITISEDGNLGIGTESASEMLHIKSAGKAAIFIEADTDNDGTETDTAYLKLSQDNAAVTSHIGFNPATEKNPENADYPDALDNALLITNDWDSNAAAVQIGVKNSVLMTAKGSNDGGKVGIGINSPSYKLDVNGDIRIRGNDIRDNSGNVAISMDGSASVSIPNDLSVDSSLTVDGRLTFKEMVFGAAQSYGGVAKYPIRELNDVLWRADLRSGTSINDTGSDRQIFYPKNDHGESIASLQSLLDRGDDQIVPIIGDANDPSGPGPSGDLFISETSWIAEDDSSETPISTLPSALFNGLWSDTQKLRHDKTHTFVINFMKNKNFPQYGLSYGEGRVYIGFLLRAANFAKIKLEGFYLQRSEELGISLNTGRWVECCDPITSLDDERNVSITPNNYCFEMTITNANSGIRPVINQRTGEVLDPVGARRSDYYLSALRITIEAGSLPLGTEGPIMASGNPQWTSETSNQDWYDNNNFNHGNMIFGCWPADIAFMPTRRQLGFETSFFHKFEDMSTIPGGIYFGDGTASDPTITFTSGDDYGIFYDSENSQMGLSGGGNEAITIDASGNITKLGQDAPGADEVLTWDGVEAKAVWSPNSATAGTTEVVVDFNVDIKPNSLAKDVVYARNSGVGNIDGGSFTGQVRISDMGDGTQQENFDRDIDTTFETTIAQARNNFICGFVADDSSLVKFQSVILPVHSWQGGVYASIWKGTYTNHSSGNIIWNRVSLLHVVNDQGTPDAADDSLAADTVCFGEDIINSNNTFSKGDLWSLIFWSDNVAVGASSSQTWVTGNLFFEKN